ncbi:hypothetical protein [Streptomyces sp. STR69]|uniref:hypothetical protein n=1 Tax=Streptomyces sp. STR69 TaxID=1796942 RepID=UPI0021C5B3A9|nr:hypothetical protein [Streptomyces sp. STR69]
MAPSRPPGIWFGDLARAVGAVGASDPETLRAVAGLLGLTPVGETGRTIPQDGEAEEQQPQLPYADPPSDGDTGTSDVPLHRRTSPVTDLTSSGEGPQLLTPVAREPRTPTVWATPSLPPASRAAHPAPHRPLLAPRSARAIIQAAVSRHEADRDVDIERAVARLAKGLPLRTLPRLPAPTLRFGAQVLVDRGPGMQPFHRDQDELSALIAGTVGREATEVLHFEDSPLRGTGLEARWTWREYAPPPPGTRVLILSDLGIGGPPHPSLGGRAAWERFFSLLAQARCTAVVFVPYPPPRWPGWAPRLVRMVPWDRTTTVGWVRMHSGPAARSRPYVRQADALVRGSVLAPGDRHRHAQPDHRQPAHPADRGQPPW